MDINHIGIVLLIGYLGLVAWGMFWLTSRGTEMWKYINELKKEVAAAKTTEDINSAWKTLIKLNEKSWHRDFSAELRVLAAILKTKEESLLPGSEVNKVRELGEQMGYGQMMEIASALWRKSLTEKGYPQSGAFVATILKCIKEEHQPTVLWVSKSYDELVNQ